MHSVSRIISFIATMTLAISGSALPGVPKDSDGVARNASALITHPTPDLGINCRGSSYCASGGQGTEAERLNVYIHQVDDNKWFNDGQKIACTITNRQYSFCAFMQKSNGSAGSKLKELSSYIVGHGCKTCGSVPYYYPGGNDVENGELTFNYVSDGCGEGLCR